ncbi:hypothetical protein RN001_006003 [Aquatica leii]|uniref:DUF4806 domain-containing protein n=1 Tax=Aquatica leii TaxID=1421715 RepID=A0AAN7PD28_9COLE|nr:hypothetical protein RN001_006003 [Aquatica leii]
MSQQYKCGLRGFLLNSFCDNVLEHECFRYYNENNHNLVSDEEGILTIVDKVVNPEPANADVSWEELLIKYVQDRPPLYHLKDEKVAVNILKTKWKYLRDCYVKSKKKINAYKPSGSASQPPPDPGFRTVSSISLPSPSVSSDLENSSTEPAEMQQEDLLSTTTKSDNSANTSKLKSTSAIKKVSNKEATQINVSLMLQSKNNIEVRKRVGHLTSKEKPTIVVSNGVETSQVIFSNQERTKISKANELSSDTNLLNKIIKLATLNIISNGREENSEYLEEFRRIFPLKEDTILQETNQILSENLEFFNYVLSTIALEGANNLNECIRKIMKIIIPDELAVKYSFKGHKNKENCSNHAHVVKLIIECVRKNEERATTRQIEDQIAIWLTKAQRRLNAPPQ